MLKSASLARKILLVCCSFMVPIAALQWLIIKAYNKDIDFGAWEFKGDKLQRPVQNLFEAVAMHKLLVGHSSDAAAAKAQLAKVQTSVEQALADTSRVEEELREDLQFTDQGLASRGRESARASKITEQWNALKGKLSKISIEDSDKLHDEIIANVRTMIVHGGDTSNLILDPDLDSYYLMDITLLAGPQMQDRLQRITAEVGDLLEKKELTFADKMKVNTFAAMLQEADLDRIKGDVGTVLNEDKNFYGTSPSVQKNLPANFEVLKGKVDKVIAHLTSVANGGKVDQDVFRADGLAALGESFRFWNSAVDELDVFLNTRLADYDGKRTTATLMSLVCLVLFTGLTVFVTRHLKVNFISAVERLKGDADAIRNLSQDIRFTSKTVASGSHEQGAAVQENVAAITEIDSMVEKTSEQASLSLANARSVAEQARQGNTVMNKMVESMQSIKSATDQLEAITSVISTIADRTNVINDIVFKTQLLSFNASIEAARAGQHGRGFAVVAEEVGNLAQMSGNAAAEIRRLIDDSKKQVDGFVKSTQERINRGETISDQAKAIFDRISTEIDQIARQVESVSDANREQKAGIGQVSMAMTQIEQVTQSNVNAASQADELSAGLEAQSQKLTEVAGMIESLVAGGKGQGRRSATTAPKAKGNGKGSSAAPKAEQPATQATAATPASVADAQGFKRVQGQGEWDNLLKDAKTEDTRKVA